MPNDKHFDIAPHMYTQSGQIADSNGWIVHSIVRTYILNETYSNTLGQINFIVRFVAKSYIEIA